MNGNKYFNIVNHIFEIQQQIDELNKLAYTNEKEFLLKLKKRVDTLEKFTLTNWLQYKKDNDHRNSL
jgi:hypothetical protein